MPTCWHGREWYAAQTGGSRRAGQEGRWPSVNLTDCDRGTRRPVRRVDDDAIATLVKEGVKPAPSDSLCRIQRSQLLVFVQFAPFGRRPFPGNENRSRSLCSEINSRNEAPAHAFHSQLGEDEARVSLWPRVGSGVRASCACGCCGAAGSTKQIRVPPRVGVSAQIRPL